MMSPPAFGGTALQVMYTSAPRYGNQAEFYARRLRVGFEGCASAKRASTSAALCSVAGNAIADRSQRETSVERGMQRQ